MCSILQVVIACGVHMHFRILKTGIFGRVGGIFRVFGSRHDNLPLVPYQLTFHRLYSRYIRGLPSANDLPHSVYIQSTPLSPRAPNAPLYQPAAFLLKVKPVVLSANLEIVCSRPSSGTRYEVGALLSRLSWGPRC